MKQPEQETENTKLLHGLEPSRLLSHLTIGSLLAAFHFSCPCIFSYFTWNSQWSPHPLTFRCGINVKELAFLCWNSEVFVSKYAAKEKKMYFGMESREQ